MPLFINGAGEGVEIIRPRPRRAEVPEGARRRLARDKAMAVLRGEGWHVASIAMVFGITPRHAANRIGRWEAAFGERDDDD